MHASRNCLSLIGLLLGPCAGLVPCALALPARAAAALRQTAVRHPQLALVPSSEPPPELPTPALLKAIARCGSTATAADVAAEAGQDIGETRRQLLSLARLVGAELQVSEEGELLFVFEPPRTLRGQLRAQSVRQRARRVVRRLSAPLLGTAGHVWARAARLPHAGDRGHFDACRHIQGRRALLVDVVRLERGHALGAEPARLSVLLDAPVWLLWRLRAGGEGVLTGDRLLMTSDGP